MANQALVARRETSRPQGKDLGMGRGVAEFPRPVPGPRHIRPPRRHDHSPHRNLAPQTRRPRLLQGYFHETPEGALLFHLFPNILGGPGADSPRRFTPRAKGFPQ